MTGCLGGVHYVAEARIERIDRHRKYLRRNSGFSAHTRCPRKRRFALRLANVYARTTGHARGDKRFVKLREISQVWLVRLLFERWSSLHLTPEIGTRHQE